MAGEGDLKQSFRRYRKATAILCLIGFILSYYAVYVGKAKSDDPSFNAMCDISASISCSKVFTSEYGTGFGIVGKLFGEDSVANQSNGVYGMIMYPVFLLCSVIAFPFFALLELIMGVAGVIISVYLGYVLFYILDDICIVCICTYVVSFFLFICSVLNYRAVKKYYTKQDPDYTYYLDGKSKKRV